jgi:hypothetical protein
MSVTKSKRKGRQLNRWLTASSDMREERFVQVGNTLFFNKAFQSLSVGARYLYIAAANEAGGNRNFQLPALKMKSLGFKERTAREYIKELEKAKFIEKVKCGRNTRTPNDYRFCFDWLNLP